MSNSNKNIALATTIITTGTTTIHIDGEPTTHDEHYFNINMLEGLGLNI